MRSSTSTIYQCGKTGKLPFLFLFLSLANKIINLLPAMSTSLAPEASPGLVPTSSPTDWTPPAPDTNSSVSWMNNSIVSPPPPPKTNSSVSWMNNSIVSPPPPPKTNSSVSWMNNSIVSPPPPPKTNSSVSSPPPDSSTTTVSLSLIVGIAGAIIVVIAVGIFVFCYCRKKRKEAQSRLGGLPSQGPKDEYATGRPQLWQQNNHPPRENNAASPPYPGISPLYHSPVLAPFSHEPPSTNRSSGPEKPLASPSPGILGFSWGTFTYEELAAASDSFSDANLIGQGGFGYVHKGVLRDGRVVAIKQLKAGSGQGEREFQAEIDIISRVHHRHLVSLFGYCITGVQRMLVYEFVPNNTLEFHLYGKDRKPMNWSTRMKIALGSAKGLAYLHEDCHPKIIHRDIKAANILLDDSFEAKVADFGLAKYYMDTDTHVSTRVMGTFGYMAPEYASSGKLTEKSDVFSFGVVLLELITGRRPVDRTQSFYNDNLVDWARPLLKQALEEGIYDPLVDRKLQDYDTSELTRMLACVAACIRHSARLRPQMSQIVRALEGNLCLDDLSDGVTPGHSTVFSSYGSLDYNSTQYKEDLKKFRKMALETQEHSSSGYSGLTSDFGVHPSSSSSESQQTTQEMESQKKETAIQDS